MTDDEGGRPAGSPVRLRQVPAAPYVCLTTYGPYWKLSGTFGRLRTWMETRGVAATGPALAVFYDDPEVTPPDACRYSICYPLDDPSAARALAALAGGLTPPTAPAGDTDEGAAVPADTLTVDVFAGTAVAAIEYAGPTVGSPQVYEQLGRWIVDQGLIPVGPPREVYLAEPGTLPKGTMHAEVQQPVEPAPPGA